MHIFVDIHDILVQILRDFLDDFCVNVNEDSARKLYCVKNLKMKVLLSKSIFNIFILISDHL